MSIEPHLQYNHCLDEVDGLADFGETTKSAFIANYVQVKNKYHKNHVEIFDYFDFINLMPCYLLLIMTMKSLCLLLMRQNLTAFISGTL